MNPLKFALMLALVTGLELAGSKVFAKFGPLEVSFIAISLISVSSWLVLTLMAAIEFYERRPATGWRRIWQGVAWLVQWHVIGMVLMGTAAGWIAAFVH